MAKDQVARLNATKLSDDIESSDALKSVAGYTPVNPQYTTANIKALYDAMIASQTDETQKDVAYKAAKDKAIAAEWAFHNAILGAKDQVKAQFGKDSNEIQALGLKKKSEYKRPKTVKA